MDKMVRQYEAIDIFKQILNKKIEKFPVLKDKQDGLEYIPTSIEITEDYNLLIKMYVPGIKKSLKSITIKDLSNYLVMD